MERAPRPSSVESRAPSWRRNPRGYVRSDERIFEDVCEALIRDRDVDTSMLRVAVKDGVVTLQGRVSSRRDKYQVEHLAASARGVKEVENDLRVLAEGFDGELHPELQRGVFRELIREHRAVSSLLDQLVAGRREAPAARLELFATLARELLSHAHAEQEVLYASLEPHMAPEVLRAREEHALVEHLIDSVDARGAVDDTWQARVEVLRSLFEHHVRGEEGRLMLDALRFIDPPKADALATRYTAVREQRRAQVEEARARPHPRPVGRASSAGAEPRVHATSEGGRAARK